MFGKERFFSAAQELKIKRYCTLYRHIEQLPLTKLSTKTVSKLF